MKLNIIAGVMIIALAYTAIWLLLLKSVRIINVIQNNDLHSLAEIQEKLKQKNGDLR